MSGVTTDPFGPSKVVLPVLKAAPNEAFDWEKEYGPLYRACPSAFWLAPGPGDRKRDVIDVSVFQFF